MFYFVICAVLQVLSDWRSDWLWLQCNEILQQLTAAAGNGNQVSCDNYYWQSYTTSHCFSCLIKLSESNTNTTTAVKSSGAWDWVMYGTVLISYHADLHQLVLVLFQFQSDLCCLLRRHTVILSYCHTALENKANNGTWTTYFLLSCSETVWFSVFLYGCRISVSYILIMCSHNKVNQSAVKLVKLSKTNKMRPFHYTACAKTIR